MAKPDGTSPQPSLLEEPPTSRFSEATLVKERVKPAAIRVIAICLLRSERGILVFEGFDRVRGKHYYRPLGGGVEPGETSREAVIREINEETGLEIQDVRLLGTLEEIFVLNGKARHEVVWVYDARFVDPSVYQKAELEVVEADGERLRAIWRTLDSFDESNLLVPESLPLLIRD